jgi:hypothetical protein
MSNWIKTSDRLPNGFAPVLVSSGGCLYISYLAPTKGFYVKREDDVDFLRTYETDYWMPIPELPKTEAVDEP